MRLALIAMGMIACGRIGFDDGPTANDALPGDAPIDPALFAWWKLDEGQGGVARDSAGNNDASLDNAQWVAGRTGTALAFVAGDKAVVTTRPSLDVTDALTVAFWLTVTDVPGDDERLVNMGGTWDVKLNGARRLPQLSVAPIGFASLDFDLPTGEWHHVAFTYDRGTVLGYIDGAVQAFVSMEAFPASLQANTQGFAMGVRTDLGNPCDCSLDDIRLYARPLTASEIMDLAR